MQMTLTIYDAKGALLLETPINEGCKWKYELMKEDYITVKLSLQEAKHFGVGSYVEWNGETWVITDTQDPTCNTSTGGYDYELTFRHDYWLWNNKIFKFTPEYGGREASWTWCADLATLMQAYLKNLSALGCTYKGNEYTVAIDSTVTTAAKTITFSNCGLIDALFGSGMIAETWDCECWIEEGVIHLGTCQDDVKDPVEFKLGVNVEKISRSNSKATYATRLYVFGGTNNIPKRYRKSLVFTVAKNGQDIADSFRVLNDDYFSDDDKTYNADVVHTVNTASFSFTADGGSPLSEDGNSSLSAAGDYTVRAQGITLTPSTDTEKAYLYTANYEGDYTVKCALQLRYRLRGDTSDTLKEIAADSLTMTLTRKRISVSHYKYISAFSKSTLPLDGEVRLSLSKSLSFWRYEFTVEVSSDIDKPFPNSDITLTQGSGGVITETQTDQYPETKALVTFTSGSLAGTSAVCTLNPGHTSEGAGTLNLPSGTTATAGDKYTIGNIINAEVPVSYFTSDATNDLVVNGVVQNRLMLPLEWNDGKNCVDAEDGLADAEIVEQVVTNDDIYPRFTTTLDDGTIVDGYACTAVKTRQALVTNEDTEEKETVTYWAFQDTKITFARKYILDGEKLQVQFTSGRLNGLTFQADFIADGSLTDSDGNEYGYGGGQWFEVIRSDDYGRYLPDDTFYPVAGDRYILLGWDSSYISDLGLVENAEKELLAWAQDYIKDTMVDPSTYTCDMMSDDAYGKNPTTGSLDENYAYQSSILSGGLVTPVIIADNAFVENLTVGGIKMYDSSGNIIFQAADGNVVANSGTFKNITVTDATVSGTINATAGQIGGFVINGTGLSNCIDGEYDNDAYIIFRNDTYGTFAGIGGNVLPTSSATRGVARFENYSKGNSWLGTYVNYAMLVGARNSYENTAIGMTGGCVAGLCLKTKVITGSTTLERGVNVVLCLNTAEITLTLPTMQTYDDGYMLWIKNLNGSNVKIKPGQSYHFSTDSAYSSSTSLASSYIHYDKGSYAKYGKSEYDDLESKGDAAMYVYVRDTYVTVDSVKYRGCWAQFKNPRDW